MRPLVSAAMSTDSSGSSVPMALTSSLSVVGAASATSTGSGARLPPPPLRAAGSGRLLGAVDGLRAEKRRFGIEEPIAPGAQEQEQDDREQGPSSFPQSSTRRTFPKVTGW